MRAAPPIVTGKMRQGGEKANQQFTQLLILYYNVRDGSARNTIFQKQTALHQIGPMTVEGLFTRRPEALLPGENPFGGLPFRSGSQGTGALTALLLNGRNLYPAIELWNLSHCTTGKTAVSTTRGCKK